MADAAASSDRSAVPGLIERLSSEDPGERLMAIRTLEWITGHTFGYDHAAGSRDREAAIERWTRWNEMQRKEGAR